MNYRFSCPHPCTQVICVEADSIDDAVGKTIKAGALRCRNKECAESCKESLPSMTPLSENVLQQIVRLRLEPDTLSL